jgi:high-affinity iron transporter
MLTVALIAFREFLEAFLIVGVFLGISRKLQLKKEFEIIIAAVVGILFSLIVSTIVFIFGDYASSILTEKNAEMLSSYLQIFSGIFLVYVIFSLHDVLRRSRGMTLIKAHERLKQQRFDLSLFFTIVFLVLREGFEIALFTSSVSLFSIFLQNFIGLFIGLLAGSSIGILTFFAYVKFPVGKLFKTTEYMIMLLGAALVQNGLTEFLELRFGFHLGDILRLPVAFLPDKESLLGHLMQNLLGLDQELSIPRVAIMLAYIGIFYILFLRKRKASPVKATM